jgi:GNAT superfamily N-acetyltransferase
MRYISDGGPDDADAIAALHAMSWRAAYRGMLPDAFLDGPLDEDRRAQWRARLASPPPDRPIVLKATEGPTLLGFACVFQQQDDIWGALLDNLHVLPGSTGQGIGAGLLRAAQQRTAAAARQRLHLWVFEANGRARRFYERHGARAADCQVAEVIPGVFVPEVRYVFDVRPL